MCGIAGYIWKDSDRSVDRSTVESMCRMIEHRGPDDEGIYLHGSVGLGHRRLSILDLSTAGHQPMISADENLVIVFNGEIYNYVELREDLKQRGCQFRTETDTEVILQAYHIWGADCVTRFNGMWALAILDRRAQSIFLSRDRLGIKPLYYAADSESFVFASEIKAILAVRPKHRQVHPETMAGFLPTGRVDQSTATFFKSVTSLPAAGSARLDLRTGSFRQWKYWHVDPQAFESTWQTNEPVEALRDLLSSVVQLHLRSDVPVGTCLSGGLDSSTLVGLMSRYHREPVRTFSGLYADTDCNEESYVSSMNAHVPTISHSVRPEPNGDLLQDLRSITWHQDEPSAGAGLYTQFHVMRTAGSQVKVILDGQGGDELFAGYLWYFRPHLRDLLARRSPVAWLTASRLVLSVWRHWGIRTLPDGFRLLGMPFYNLMRRIGMNRADSGFRHAPDRVLHPRLAESLQSGDKIPRRFSTELAHTMHQEMVSTSIPSLLHYEDRNSMAFSIEARVPYLDYRLVEMAFALDARWKISGSWTKWILRKVASEFLPKDVAWRRSKMGYPTPMARWLRKDSEKKQIEEVLFSPELRKRELVSPRALETIWKEHQAGVDHSWMLYRILTLEIWHQHYIDALVPCPAKQQQYQSRAA